jgi:hypothetical protein
MELVNIVLKSKVVWVTVLLGVLYTTEVYTVYNSSMTEEPTSNVKNNAEVTKQEETKPVELEMAAMEVPSDSELFVDDTPELAQAQAPSSVRSIEEIAKDYPHMFQTQYDQECLNAIVAMYPERFTEDVREKNMKALTAFASYCSTGVPFESKRFNNTRNYLDAYGGKGSFFDSELAKSRY